MNVPPRETGTSGTRAEEMLIGNPQGELKTGMKKRRAKSKRVQGKRGRPSSGGGGAIRGQPMVGSDPSGIVFAPDEWGALASSLASDGGPLTPFGSPHARKKQEMASGVLMSATEEPLRKSWPLPTVPARGKRGRYGLANKIAVREGIPTVFYHSDWMDAGTSTNLGNMLCCFSVGQGLTNLPVFHARLSRTPPSQ